MNGKTQQTLLNYGVSAYRSKFSYAGCVLSNAERRTFTTSSWYKATRDIRAWRGKVVILCFWVQDASDSAYDTAALIDKIVIS